MVPCCVTPIPEGCQTTESLADLLYQLRQTDMRPGDNEVHPPLRQEQACRCTTAILCISSPACHGTSHVQPRNALPRRRCLSGSVCNMKYTCCAVPVAVSCGTTTTDSSLVRSARVVKAMETTDRGFYTPQDAYEDRQEGGAREINDWLEAVGREYDVNLLPSHPHEARDEELDVLKRWYFGFERACPCLHLPSTHKESMPPQHDLSPWSCTPSAL